MISNPSEQCESIFSNSTNSKIHIAQEHSIRNTNWGGFSPKCLNFQLNILDVIKFQNL